MNDASAARRRKMLTLVGIYLALVVNLMTSTTNATVFPAAAADIGGMDIYGLAQGVSGILSVCIMPIYGALGACRPALERILCGGSLMVGAAVLFVRGIAPSMIWIIASNVLWGLVSAGVFVLGFSMIRDMYDKVQAGVYLGMVGTMQSLGMLAGPFIGGLVIDHIGWRVFCFLLFALLALAGMFVLLGQRSFGEVPDSVNGKLGIDKLGAFAMVVFLGCFIIAVSMGTTWIPFGSIASTVLFVVAAVGLVVLVIDLRRKGSSAIVPLDALKDRNVMVFSCLNFFYNFGAMSLTFFVPGFVMTSMTGGFAGWLLGRRVGRWSRAHDSRDTRAFPWTNLWKGYRQVGECQGRAASRKRVAHHHGCRTHLRARAWCAGVDCLPPHDACGRVYLTTFRNDVGRTADSVARVSAHHRQLGDPAVPELWWKYRHGGVHAGYEHWSGSRHAGVPRPHVHLLGTHGRGYAVFEEGSGRLSVIAACEIQQVRMGCVDN